ncbi:MAG TPA: ABC transporter permease [Candidatus Limnocylindrales bacterium]|nr:ABC transporter permease [Candidatus Limnocylindrales bacterium]
MTAATTAAPITGEGLAARRAVRDARLRGIAFIALTLLAAYAAMRSLETPAHFSFWIDRQGGASAKIDTTVGVLWLIAALACGIVAIQQFARGAAFRWRPWLFLIVAPIVVATFATLLNGTAASLTNVFSGTMELAAPITLGALAGILSERSGMLNIALEGKMLVGACVAALVSSAAVLATGNPIVSALLGVAVAMLAAGLLGLLLAWLGIRHKVDQIIAGTVINIGAIGITNFLFLRILGRNVELNTPATIGPFRIPVLADLPVLGPIMFSAKPYVYVGWIMVLVLTYMLFRTRWGLRLRASGEKPAAAGTVGINVIAIRYRALFLAGLISGLAGSYLSLSTAGSFQMEMTAGKGYIALAAMIFGAWHPIGALGAALVFGFADTTQSLLSILGSSGSTVQVPPQLLNSVPYLVTIIVVAGVVGRVRGPAAAGQPYEQG